MDKLNDLVLAGGQLKSPGKSMNIVAGAQLKASRIGGHKSSPASNGIANNNNNCHNDSAGMFNLSQLIPYPASCISTSIERPNGSIADDIDAASSLLPPIVVGRRKRSKIGGKDSKSPSSSPKTTTTTSMNSHQSFSSSPQSNIPAITPPDVDLDRIVRLLTDKKEADTQTPGYIDYKPLVEQVNQFVQVNIINEEESSAIDPNMFELRRSNQSLKGQLEQLGYVVEEMSKERSTIQLHLHTTQKTIAVKELKIKELEAECNKIAAHNDTAKYSIGNLECQLVKYREQIQEQVEQYDLLRQELEQMKMERNQLIDQNNKLKSDNVQKDMIIARLSSTTSNVNPTSNGSSDVRDNANLAIAQEQLRQANAEIETLATQRYQLLVQLNQKDRHQESIRKSLSNVKDELATLKNVFAGEVQVLTNRHMPELQNYLQHLFRHFMEQSNASLNAEFDAFKYVNEMVIKEKLKTIDTLNETIDKNRAELTKMKNNVDELGEEVNKLTLERDDSAKKVIDFASKLNDYEATVAKQRALIEENQLRYEVAQNQIACLRQDNQTLKTQQTLISETNKMEAKFDSSRLEAQLKEMSDRIELQVKTNETLLAENNQLKQELQTKRDQITSLESSIQILTKKYREFVQSGYGGDGDIGVMEEVSVSTMLDDLGRLQRLLMDKDKLLQAQNDRLVQFDFEQRNLLGKLAHYETDNEFERLVQENKALLEQIESLRKELKREKDRSSGLSESIFNEKRTNKKLQDQLKSAVKQRSPQQEDQTTQTDLNDVVIDINLDDSPPTFSDVDAGLDDLHEEMSKMKQLLIENLQSSQE